MLISSKIQNNNNKNILFSEEKTNSSTKLKINEYKTLKKIAMNNINKRYGPKTKLKYQYFGLIMENLVFNKNSHLVSLFKDYMIWDYIEEFLKRYYKGFESTERMPKFASFYKNYLKFFCVPTFKEYYCNEMIHNYSEKKAELFYNANYRKKKESESEQKDCGLFEESESEEESDSKLCNNIEKTIFNATIKKKIERYSPINTSMALPESDTKLKPDDSGLLITSSNETSLVNIMEGMTPPPPKKENKKIKNLDLNFKTDNNKNNNSKNKLNIINDKIIINKSNIESNKEKINNNIKSNINNNYEDGSNSYRFSQKNLISNTLNKLNNQNLESILINSQRKKRNISSGFPKKNNINKNIHLKNNNNELLKNKFYNNNNHSNSNKIFSYMGIYKKKSIPKSRNENKLLEEDIKSQPKPNNFIININNNNIVGTINIKKNNNLKNITSINNSNLNYRQGLQRSRNQQQSLSINSNTYSKNSLEKINNIKKNINLNTIKNSNIEFILNQLKVHPFLTLKKSPSKKGAYSNLNNNKRIEEKKPMKNSKIPSADYPHNQRPGQGYADYGRNSTKNISLNNKMIKDIRPYSHKNDNSPSVLNFMKKSTFKLVKSSNPKDVKLYKKSMRNFSYNGNQKNDNEQKYLKGKNIKMSFDGIMNNNNMNKNYNNKKSNNIDNKGPINHIHNVNININNQINIGGRQLHELFSFSDLVKKSSNNNNIYNLLKNNNKNANYISRNKNQSLDFNSYVNINNNNHNSLGGNKLNPIIDNQNGSNKNMFKTQYKLNSVNSGTTIYNKNKETKKIRLTNSKEFMISLKYKCQ